MDLPVPDGQEKDKSFASHSTMSKSFGLQRKTLVRVIGLEKKVAAIEKNNVQLMDDYKDITTSIKNINDNLLGIQQVLQDDLVADQDAADQANIDNRRAADYKKKTKKEAGIEKAILGNFQKPLSKLTGKVQNIFGQFFKALGLIFSAWLLDKGIKLLDAFKKDPERFEKIKNEVLKVLAIGGGIMLAISGGIALIIASMGGLIASIVFSIPGLLATLANPLVWAGIAAVLGRYLQASSGFERAVMENADTEGIADTIAELELAKEGDKEMIAKYGLPSGPSWLTGRNAEIQKQIDALLMGYHGTGDLAYREMGLKNFVPRVPFLNDQYLQDTDLFKQLVKRANETNMSDEDLKQVLQLIQAYRALSRDKVKAQQLNLEIFNPQEGRTKVDVKNDLEEVTNNITTNEKIIKTILENEKIANLDSELRVMMLGNTGEGTLNPENLNALADLMMVLFPKALPENFGNRIDNTRLFDQESDNTILGNQSNSSTSSGDSNSLVAHNHGNDGSISHVSTNTNQNEIVALASQNNKKNGTTKVEVHPVSGESNDGNIVKGDGISTEIDSFALVNPLNRRYTDMYGAVYG